MILVVKYIKEGKVFFMSRRSPVIKEQILTYMQDYIAVNGFSPSVREVVAAVHLSSTSVASAYIKELVQDGLIRKTPSKSRALDVVGARKIDETEGFIPVIKKYTEGVPFLSDDNISGYLSIPLPNGAGDTSFAVRVKDSSMEDVGIYEGDIVVATNSGAVDNGDIVVCLVNGEIMIRTVYIEDDESGMGAIKLAPAGKGYEPEYADDFRAVGVLSAVIHYRR